MYFCICIYIYINIYIHINIYMNLYMYIYEDTKTDTETHTIAIINTDTKTKTNTCQHARCWSTLMTSSKVARNLTARTCRDQFIDLRSVGQEGTLFAGKRVVQHLDFRVTVSMDEHAKVKLRPMKVPQGHLSNTKEVNEGMLTNIRRVNGVSWLVGINRKTRHGSDSLDHSFWVRPKIAAVGSRKSTRQ